MSLFRQREHHVPGLNTASLPDLIFTVLFFFMIVTHMRKATVKVQYRLPAGTELTRLTKKSAVNYLYIGRTAKGVPTVGEGSSCIQLNDKLVDVGEVADYMTAERDRMTAEDLPNMTVSIKADEATPVGVIADVKHALREAGALKISYSALSRKEQRRDK